MGAACSTKASHPDESTSSKRKKGDGGDNYNDPAISGTVGVMFKRIDKDNKGYIDIDDLEKLMQEDKNYFQGKGASHIMNKYGNDDSKMGFTEFNTWWNSTYTTYNEDDIVNLVSEVQQGQNERIHTKMNSSGMDSIQEEELSTHQGMLMLL